MSARMQVSVSEDRQTATLALLPGSGLEGKLDLSFDQLSQLINSLGQVRAAMQGARAVPPMEGASITPVFNTPWTVRPEALTEGSVIAFQHPAFGPVGFVLAPPDVEKVVRALTVHLGMVHSNERPQGKPS
ncbi:hypothetical protein [Rhizosaccharibacter radicis]|uniref:Uncharacterized protein n=1 Tax=Rhizosaccharibacter radicis TaxID=2782605 RepID=A0ABT1W0H3_9PROT|nr:hypothetical protein [Acetobacteraceae bacterium KSS12]